LDRYLCRSSVSKIPVHEILNLNCISVCVLSVSDSDMRKKGVWFVWLKQYAHRLKSVLSLVIFVLFLHYLWFGFGAWLICSCCLLILLCHTNKSHVKSHDKSHDMSSFCWERGIILYTATATHISLSYVKFHWTLWCEISLHGMWNFIDWNFMKNFIWCDMKFHWMWNFMGQFHWMWNFMGCYEVEMKACLRSCLHKGCHFFLINVENSLASRATNQPKIGVGSKTKAWHSL
jgi:hypothetical protein